MAGLAIRALRWRAALSAVVWACAVVVCAGAALGPVFALAATESGVQDVLRDAGAATGIGLDGVSHSSPELTPAEAQQRLRSTEEMPALAHRPRRIESLFLAASGRTPQGKMSTRLVWRTGTCGDVRIIRGRCPLRAGEGMVSSRAVALRFGWDLGRSIPMTADDSPATTTVRIVGIYRPRSTTSPVWSDHGYFQQSVDTQGDPITDAVFVPKATFTALPGTARVQQSVDLPLDVAGVRLADLPGLRRQITALRRTAPAADLAVVTSMGRVLDRAAALQSKIEAATLLVVLQLCVLGWLVLHRVLVDTVEARSADIALAKLRGFGRWSLIRFGLGEPVVLLVSAIPVGAALGLLGGLLLTRAVLRPGTPVVFPAEAGLALAVALLGGVVAVVSSSWSALRSPVLEQWRRTRVDRRPSAVGVVWDALVAAGAVAAFVVLRLVGVRAGPVALLGPGLLVAAVGLLGARLVPLLLRPLVPATSASRRIAVFLAVRQVVRRPAGLRLVALLTIAVGLAVFGVGGEAVAAQNRGARAAAEVGATRVERLQTVAGQDVLGEVARADPDGRWAAAEASWLNWGGPDLPGRVIALDARRLGAVGVPAAGLPSPRTLAAQLLRGSVAPRVVRGTRLQAVIRTRDLAGGHAPQVAFELSRTSGTAVQVVAGALRTGAATYSAAVPCAAGCAITGITLIGSVVDPPSAAVTGTITVAALRVDGRTVPADLDRPHGWRSAVPEGQASDRVRPTAGGLEDRFTTSADGTGGVLHGDVLIPVPAVVGGAGARVDRTGALLTAVASDQSSARFVVAGARPVLPAALDDGVLVDVRSFQAALPAFAVDATWSVWLGASAPPDALDRLRAAGLTLDGGASLSARTAELARQGPALALLLLAVCSAAGALLAMGGTSVSIAAAVRRRSYEAAALSTVGVERGQLHRAALAEQLLLLGTAVVVGVPAGLVALLLALPAVPQSADASPVPMAVLPSPLPVLVCALTVAALVAATAVVSAGRVVRAGSAARLREGEE